MSDINNVVIASYATKGNARRIRVLKETDGTYSYGEFYHLDLVGAGVGYRNRAEIEKAVAGLILAYREVDGINYHKVETSSQ